MLAPVRGRNANMAAAQVKLERGTHEIKLAGDWTLEEQRVEPSAEKRGMHYRLLGMEPGDDPLDPRNSARRVLASFLPRAFRRPVEAGEVDKFLAMYDRADHNGTEQRVFAGNFLLSTGANEFAGRHTLGHFDLPMRHCTVALDGEVVVNGGVLQGDLA